MMGKITWQPVYESALDGRLYYVLMGAIIGALIMGTITLALLDDALEREKK